MGGVTTSYYGFVAQYAMIEMFNWWGNQGMGANQPEGLWNGSAGMFENSEG